MYFLMPDSDGVGAEIVEDTKMMNSKRKIHERIIKVDRLNKDRGQ
jgi:hypothetical protein